MLENDDAIAKLRREASMLAAVLSNAVDAIITIDDQGIVESVNPATERLFGYTADEVIGRNIKMLMPSPYCEEHDGYIRNYLSSGVAKIIGTGREVVGRRKGGDTFPMHLAVSQVQLEDRRIFTGIVRDISDLKAAEAALAELNDELEARVQERTSQLRKAQEELVQKERLATLGQVAGGIAHEIRNPLNAVKTSAYFLLNAQNPTQEKTREHLDRVERQVTMIDNVVTALSDVAKLPEPNYAAVDFVPMIRQIVSSVSMPVSIETEVVAPDNLPDVVCDPHQIPIVFRNLVRNARDAMPDGGKLAVHVREVDNGVQTQVIDQGIGIPKDDLKRVLEPLYSTKARGMGLGLAISNTIVEKNGGHLTIESERGVGSTFTVVLPKSKESRKVHD